MKHGGTIHFSTLISFVSPLKLIKSEKKEMSHDMTWNRTVFIHFLKHYLCMGDSQSAHANPAFLSLAYI